MKVKRRIQKWHSNTPKVLRLIYNGSQGSFLETSDHSSMSGTDEKQQQQEVEYFEYEAKHVRSTINSYILRVIKFITKENLRYRSKFSQVCLNFMHRDVKEKKYWNTFKKYFGRALNTKRSTCSVSIMAAFMAAFMSKLTRI
jgi:hypothetical protein